MGALGIGKQRRKVPLILGHMQDRQPRFSLWVQSLWGNGRQRTSGGLLAIDAIYLQQHRYGRLHQRCLALMQDSPLTLPPQDFIQRSANACQATRANAFDPLETAVASRKLQRFKGIDMQGVTDAGGEFVANPRHHLK